jgi:hypothetical protein
MSCGERRNSSPSKYVSNITYFGKPVYTYSLKQGIEDGFLVPFGLSVLTSTSVNAAHLLDVRRATALELVEEVVIVGGHDVGRGNGRRAHT